MNKVNTNETWVEITLALMRKNQQVLVGLRKGMNVWEFPGGKIKQIKPPEKPHEALKRELKEELDIEAEIGSLRGVFCSQFPDKKYKQLFYLFDVFKWQNKIMKKVHTQLKWVYPHELNQMKIHELNKAVLPEIISILQ